MTAAADPRRFRLNRLRDISGISGTGVVAHGVQWHDGTVALRWMGPVPSTVVWRDVAAVEEVHGHSGATVIEWVDDDAA